MKITTGLHRYDHVARDLKTRKGKMSVQPRPYFARKHPIKLSTYPGLYLPPACGMYIDRVGNYRGEEQPPFIATLQHMDERLR